MKQKVPSTVYVYKWLLCARNCTLGRLEVIVAFPESEGCSKDCGVSPVVPVIDGGVVIVCGAVLSIR